MNHKMILITRKPAYYPGALDDRSAIMLHTISSGEFLLWQWQHGDIERRDRLERAGYIKPAYDSDYRIKGVTSMSEQKQIERLEDLTVQEQLSLQAADEIYCFDWRENDDDDKTAGWRHPGYFIEINVAIDFPKLVSAGLMECNGNTEHTPSYRISKRGMALVADYQRRQADKRNAWGNFVMSTIDLEPEDDPRTPADIAGYEARQDEPLQPISEVLLAAEKRVKQLEALNELLERRIANIHLSLAVAVDESADEFGIDALLTAVHKVYWESDKAAKRYLQSLPTEDEQS